MTIESEITWIELRKCPFLISSVCQRRRYQSRNPAAAKMVTIVIIARAN